MFYESIWHMMWGEHPWIGDEKYGTCIDKDLERPPPSRIMNKQKARCMHNVIHCPQPLCLQSPTCHAAVDAAYSLG